MTYTVHYRKADGRGTVSADELDALPFAIKRQRDLVDKDQAITMCWILDAEGHLVGDMLP